MYESDILLVICVYLMDAPLSAVCLTKLTKVCLFSFELMLSSIVDLLRYFVVAHLIHGVAMVVRFLSAIVKVDQLSCNKSKSSS